MILLSSCSLYVNYLVELPAGWTAGEDTTLQGVTQVCTTSGDTAHLAAPLEADLFFSINSLEGEAEVMPRWPQLLVEVVSVDYWARCRVEGYGHTVLPAHPGHHNIQVRNMVS